MEDQLTFMFESFKQELTDLYTINGDVILHMQNDWRGEASMEYINALHMSGKDILDILRQVENLQNKVNVFMDLLSQTDTST